MKLTQRDLIEIFIIPSKEEKLNPTSIWKTFGDIWLKTTPVIKICLFLFQILLLEQSNKNATCQRSCLRILMFKTCPSWIQLSCLCFQLVEQQVLLSNLVMELQLLFQYLKVMLSIMQFKELNLLDMMWRIIFYNHWWVKEWT
mgnify:CR=1 FL=1